MFELKITQPSAQNEQVIAKFIGELDSSAAPKFNKELQPVIDAAEKNIVLDMTDLEYISSAGLRTLMMLAKNTTFKGGSISTIGIREEIREIFQLTGFDKIFNL